ncbi:MAG TPA: DUF6059 family protein [Streptosporangiaceae bacterium]|jgi:hypothetical protein
MSNDKPRHYRQRIVRRLYRFLIEAGTCMAPMFGMTWPAHGSASAGRDDQLSPAGTPPPGHPYSRPAAALTRAEQRQWRKLVGQLEAPPRRENLPRKPGPAGPRRLDRSPRDP